MVDVGDRNRAESARRAGIGIHFWYLLVVDEDQVSRS